MKLTERKIEQLKVDPGRKDKLVFDDEQRGLAVRVTAKGGKNYLCQYTLHGQKWRVPLGACSALALAKARGAAAAIMGDVAKGKNPATERKEAAAAERAKRLRDRLTLAVLIDDWARLHLAGKRPSYRAEAVRALRHAFSEHLDKPAEDLERSAVVRALDALARRRKGRNGRGSKGAAIVGRTAAYGRAAFGWAMKRGTVSANPFASLPIAKSVTKRERVLNDDEIAEIWRATDKASFPYGIIVRLLLLTGQRRAEVAGMTWAELSDDLATWTIPGTRTKNGAPHVVPLSKPAQELVRALLPDDAREASPTIEERRAKGTLVLPGAMGNAFEGWSKSKRALDDAMAQARTKAAAEAGIEPGPTAAWTLHDLRRTLATGLQRLGVRLEVTEAVLNHISGSRAGIVGVYQRHDWATEKRNALNSWAAHVLTAVAGRTATDKVVALARVG
jgi:integrase